MGRRAPRRVAAGCRAGRRGGFLCDEAGGRGAVERAALGVQAIRRHLVLFLCCACGESPQATAQVMHVESPPPQADAIVPGGEKRGKKRRPLC
eukprot:7390127-Prymnesium_polylepis.1